MADFKPGKYAVTNEGKRARTRGGLTFPGAEEGKPTTTVVEVTSSRVYHQIKTTQWLEIKAATKAEAKKAEAEDPAGDGEPAKNASTADWLEYAVSQGADPEEVAELSRDELAEAYGS